MNTLQDLNVYLARKQQGVVNNMLEGNPITATIPVRGSSSGIYNVYSKVTGIDAMGEVDYDDELPTVGVDFELGRTRLGQIGGKLQMPLKAAEEMGGFTAFANSRMPLIIQKSANEKEAQFYYKGFLATAVKNGNVVGCGGSTANSQYSMTFVHWDMDSTVGLYNPNSLSNGKLFATVALNNGAIYELNIGGKQILGKTIASWMEFGLQLADERNVAALVNIEPTPNGTDPDKIDGLPTRKNIEDAIATVRGNPANTKIYAHPSLLGYLAIKYQLPQRVISNETTGLRYQLVDWNGIEMIGSYNVSRGKEAVISL